MTEVIDPQKAGNIEVLLTDTAKMLRAKFTTESLLVYATRIKPEFSYLPDRPDGDESHENRFVPVGVILKDKSGKLLFMYTSLYTLDHRARRLALDEMNPVEIYCGVSFEAFCQAEQLFLSNQSLGKIYKFLTRSKQEEDKLARQRHVGV